MNNIPLTVSEILTASGMSKVELSRRFSIPYRTIQHWCSDGNDKRDCPEYIRLMMQEILKL
jgi:transposase